MGFKLTVDSLNKKSETELTELLGRVKYCIANKGDNHEIDNYIKAGLSAAEKTICARTPLKVQGTTAALYANDQFLDDLETLKLEYLTFGSVDYRLRLLLSIGKTGMTMHAINSNPVFKQFQEQQQQQAKKQAKKNVNVNVSRDDNLADGPVLDEPLMD